ncbi:MFS transporter [Streptomyces sp. NBC_01537]|uniref:MFS transporter n=1 Tax=Streptomyces sp. NBC_01537 TaxID=2903896 RepID=UPI003867EB7D
MASVARTVTSGPGPIRKAGNALARVVHRSGSATRRRVRRHTHAGGAGESGLAKLIELHAVNSAGDMLITIALASTIFFSVPTGEARGRVALYLLVTMAPFALLAPVIGPLLDRIPHGRRAAMAMSMLTRAILAWTMADLVSTAGLELYPAALGVLVASKAYGVVRSAVVPRLLPARTTLVKANSRVTLAGLLATAVAAPIGGLLHLISPGAPLYGAFVVFVGGTVLSFSLPHKVDSAKGEARAQLTSGEHHLPGHHPSMEKEEPAARPGLRTVGPAVLNALGANAALRFLSGFLTLFLAFLLREQPLGGLSAAFSLGVVAVAAGAGNAFGTALGSWLRARPPEKIIATALTCALVAVTSAAAWYGPLTIALVAAVAGISQALSKLSLDATIQRDVPEQFRTSAFARSETALQMAWVIGGALGIVLPLNGTLGMSVAAAVVASGFLVALRGLRAAPRRGAGHPRAA